MGSFHVICLTSESHISFLRSFSLDQNCQVFSLSSVFSWHTVKLSSYIKLLKLKSILLKFINTQKEIRQENKQQFIWKTGKCSLCTLFTGLLLVSDLKLFKTTSGVPPSSKDENMLSLHCIPVRRVKNWKMGNKYLNEGISCISGVG